MRDQIAAALKQALRDKNPTRVATLRLITAAIKNRDIAARTENDDSAVDDAAVLDLLSKMIKQREESARLYEEGGRLELAERERAEIVVIQEFMPRQMSAAEIDAAVSGVVETLGASGIRDMGKVMAELKSRYAGQFDPAAASQRVKAALTASV